MQKKNSITIVIFLSFISNLGMACQQPQTSYLQRLPADLWKELTHFSMAHEPLWRDEKEITRVDTAQNICTLAQELCKYELQPKLIKRMRADLANAKKAIIEQYIINDDEGALFDIGDTNPKTFKKLLPLKGILSYWPSDQEWLKNFLSDPRCGGTLRKHIFIVAMKYRHEPIVNYLWNSRYRKKMMQNKMRNRCFMEMAAQIAQSAGYTSIHVETKKAYDAWLQKRKAAVIWHPG